MLYLYPTLPKHYALGNLYNSMCLISCVILFTMPNWVLSVFICFYFCLYCMFFMPCLYYFDVEAGNDFNV